MQLPVPSINACWPSGRQANKPHAAEGATVTGEPSGLVTDRPIRPGGAGGHRTDSDRSPVLQGHRRRTTGMGHGGPPWTLRLAVLR